LERNKSKESPKKGQKKMTNKDKVTQEEGEISLEGTK
jgi:hypothetical protein